MIGRPVESNSFWYENAVEVACSMKAVLGLRMLHFHFLLTAYYKLADFACFKLTDVASLFTIVIIC